MHFCSRNAQVIVRYYIKQDNITAEAVNLPNEHENYYPPVSFMQKELLITAIQGLKYYVNKENEKKIYRFVDNNDKDIRMAALNTIKYYRKM